jgi:serine/threonine protein kinase
MRLVENTVVAGRFRLNHVLGRGGMGAVWHATHLGLDIPCAIKFVKGELADQEDIKQRFEREAKAAAQLRSPHVVQILDHGVCEGTPYIAMELLDGEDLGMRLQKKGRLPPEELHKIMSEASRALAKAHAQGIVHRDLKPDNIFLVRDDDREITKVLDFGIAKTVTNELGGSGTKTGAMLGTPYYMSPEQAQGTKTVDFRSDLWSLAVISYQCLTGALPFESEALGDLLVKIIISPIPVPSQIAPVPAGFDKWWAKASSRDPADRFQSAKEFSDALALVCGVSHVSGVIDRSQLRVVAESSGERPAALPAAARTPQPVAGGTIPATQGMPVPRTPPPAAGSPAAPTTERVSEVGQPLGNAGLGPPTRPLGASQPGANQPPNAATPTPLSRSFAMDPVAKPASRVGLVIALAVGGLLFAATLVGIGWFAFRERGQSAAASAAAASASAAAAAASSAASDSASASASATPSGSATATAPSAGQPAGDTPAADPGAAQNAAPPSSGNGGNGGSGGNGASAGGGGGGSSGSGGSSHGRPAKPPGAGGAKPKPGKPADMGF